MKRRKTPTVAELLARIEELERKLAAQTACPLPHYPMPVVYVPFQQTIPEPRSPIWPPIITCGTTGSIGTTLMTNGSTNYAAGTTYTVTRGEC